MESEEHLGVEESFCSSDWNDNKYGRPSISTIERFYSSVRTKRT